MTSSQKAQSKALTRCYGAWPGQSLDLEYCDLDEPPRSSEQKFPKTFSHWNLKPLVSRRNRMWKSGPALVFGLVYVPGSIIRVNAMCKRAWVLTETWTLLQTSNVYNIGSALASNATQNVEVWVCVHVSVCFCSAHDFRDSLDLISGGKPCRMWNSEISTSCPASDLFETIWSHAVPLILTSSHEAGLEIPNPP